MTAMNTSLAQSGEAARCDEILSRLATVSDPELDESVADMGFIEFEGTAEAATLGTFDDDPG